MLGQSSVVTSSVLIYTKRDPTQQGLQEISLWAITDLRRSVNDKRFL